MSLEEKFAALSIDDIPSVVEATKSDVKAFGKAVPVLVARCDAKDEADCLAALQTVTAVAKGVPEAQPFTKECLGACTYHHIIIHCVVLIGMKRTQKNSNHVSLYPSTYRHFPSIAQECGYPCRLQGCCFCCLRSRQSLCHEVIVALFVFVSSSRTQMANS